MDQEYILEFQTLKNELQELEQWAIQVLSKLDRLQEIWEEETQEPMFRWKDPSLQEVLGKDPQSLADLTRRLHRWLLKTQQIHAQTLHILPNAILKNAFQLDTPILSYFELLKHLPRGLDPYKIDMDGDIIMGTNEVECPAEACDRIDTDGS